MNEPRAPFDAVTMCLHWLTLALVVALFATAWLHAGVSDADSARNLLQAHRSLGVTVWAVTLFRLIWRLTGARLPPFPSSMGALHRAVAKASEYALYALLLVQPITGMAQTLLRGRAFDLFLVHIGPLIPREPALMSLVHDVHEAGGWALLSLVGVHAAAALFHHFVLRDGVLTSMAPMLGGVPRDQTTPNPIVSSASVQSIGSDRQS
jgi:cytochrome b561